MKTGLLFGILLAVLVDFTMAHGEYTVAVLRWLAAIPHDMRGWSNQLWGNV